MARGANVPRAALLPVDLSRFDGAAFDLDGVLTQTATVHAAAWKRLFDDFLAADARREGRPFEPFDPDRDYLRYVDGKPRRDGIRDFLASRGIALAEGATDDPPDRATLHGLGRRKNALFLEQLEAARPRVFEGAVDFVRKVRAAGLRTAVVSSSENTAAILAATGLAELFDVRVDGIVAAQSGLAGKPAPDTFLHAAKLLGIAPARLLGVEDALAGIAAIRAAGYGLVIGVDRRHQARELAARGADLVVTDLGDVPVLAGRPNPPGETRPYATPTPDPQWVLREEGFLLQREHEIESLFAIGNGHVGTRGSLAEGSRLSSPATFVAGVFDSEPGRPPALARVPDWTRLSVAIEGQPVHLETGTHLLHERVLDMRQAILFRRWRHRDEAGRVTHVDGFRLASGADRYLLLQSILFTPENYSGTVTFDASLAEPASTVTSSGTRVAFAARTTLEDLRRKAVIAQDPAGPQSLQVELGTPYRLNRMVSVHTSRETADPRGEASRHADRARGTGMPALVAQHVGAWSDFWRRCDMRIEGDAETQQALRFAIYHLLSAVNPDDPRSSIAARALTGSAYQGHVFWDTDIFMLPFFTLTFPEAARALLRYRHHTLPAARRRAAAAGFAGAWYAWESADTGDDVTPPLVVQPDGEVVPVLTGQQEQHISADIAYAVWQYWLATGDEDFLLDAGAEILFETARFWAGRAERGNDGLQHINRVIGPDEYHEQVDDNAYTNAMARWNLRTAAHAAALLRSRWPRQWEQCAARLQLAADEPGEWQAVAASLYDGFDPATGLIEQFRGYFQLEDVATVVFEKRTAPMDVLLGRERIRRSQLIKQADVVMLLHLLWDEYPAEVRVANFRYYEPRCAHGSSLSPAIHALVAARLGDMALALRYLRQAMQIDLADNMGNASGGVHAGALGGLWQAIAFGFAGLGFTGGGRPKLSPHLPAAWRDLSFQVMWQGRAYELRASTFREPAP